MSKKKNEKKNELVEKNDDALKELLNERQRHLFDLRSQAVTEKLDDHTQLGKTKKEIARIKTMQHQRALSKGQLGKGQLAAVK